MKKEEAARLTLLETRVRQLILAYKDLEAENIKVRDLLRQKEEEVKQLEQEKTQLSQEYKTLKAARIVEICSGDAKEARARINRLIREVDSCIAMLNA